jgi:hypothetical protein
VGFCQDCWHFVGIGMSAEGGADCFGIKLRGAPAGKPVAAGTVEEVLAHLAPLDEIERLGIGPQTNDLLDVNFPGESFVVRKVLHAE